MLVALLLAAAASSPSALDAERSFAAMAQTHGQWTAFRAYAASDALMFVPETVNAQAWLKGRADTPRAVMWWPGRAILSCDGKVAVNSGPWVRQGGASVGYFTTIWVRQQDGSWKWVLDHGDVLDRPRPAGDKVAVESPICRGLPSAGKAMAPLVPDSVGKGSSPDGSIIWEWQVRPDASRTVRISKWDGRTHVPVLVDEVVERRD
jgi:hypothetical protein